LENELNIKMLMSNSKKKKNSAAVGCFACNHIIVVPSTATMHSMVHHSDAFGTCYHPKIQLGNIFRVVTKAQEVSEKTNYSMENILRSI
jgi:hypothetical protein